MILPCVPVASDRHLDIPNSAPPPESFIQPDGKRSRPHSARSRLSLLLGPWAPKCPLVKFPRGYTWLDVNASSLCHANATYGRRRAHQPHAPRSVKTSRPAPRFGLAMRLILGLLTLVGGSAVAFGVPAVADSQPAAAATSPAGPGSPVPAYWLVASDGGIFSFGGAKFYGSTGSMTLNKPVVGIAGTPGSTGYWLVASDGGIFSFGDAQFYGSMGGKPLNQPVVGMAATPTGAGYWLVASDGGIFSFGDARFYGSMGGKPLNQPIVGMAASPTGTGYTMVAADGGIFSFGHAPFYGSLGGVPLSRPIVGMAMTPTGHGYWFTDDNGAVSAFGQAGYFGSAPQVLNQPVVGIAEATGTGAFTSQPYPPESYGYDVSVFQCTKPLPPEPHVIGVVEVNGDETQQTAPNPCLAQEASWAGAGLNLYDFLTFGTTHTGPGACAGDQACNFGFHQAQNTFAMARQAGVDTAVTWWLDVEPAGGWSGNPTQNAQVVSGALLGIRAEGINTVGIYASPGDWNTIVGPYQPPVPYWMAWYTASTGGGGPYNCAHVTTWTSNEALPTGPVVMTQYSDSAGPRPGFDGDYAC